MILVSRQKLMDALAAIQADSLNTMTVILIKDDLPPLEETTAADLVAAKADFNGYADEVGVDMVGPVVNDQGQVELLSPNLTFIKTAGATVNTVYAYAFMNVGLTEVHFWEKFDTPQEMVDAGDVVSFVGRYNQLAPTSSGQPTE